MSHSVVGPGTMVVHLENADAQGFGMMSSLGLISLAFETIHLHAILGRRVIFRWRSRRHYDGDDVRDPDHGRGADEESQLVVGNMVRQNVDGRERRQREDDYARNYHSYPRIGECDHGGTVEDTIVCLKSRLIFDMRCTCVPRTSTSQLTKE